MATYWAYRIETDDSDNAPEAVRHGVVLAEEEDVRALLEPIEGRHRWFAQAVPVETAAISLDEFRHELGRGLHSVHENAGNPVCPDDVDLIRAYWLKSFGQEPPLDVASPGDSAGQEVLEGAEELTEADEAAETAALVESYGRLADAINARWAEHRARKQASDGEQNELA